MSRVMLLLTTLMLAGCGDGGGAIANGLTLIAGGIVLAALINFAANNWRGR